MTTSQPKVLLTYDGSEASRLAFAPAARIARLMQGSLVLVRVNRAPNEVWVHPEAAHRDSELAKLNAEWEAELAKVASDLSAAEGVAVEPCSRTLGKRWNVSGEILACADEYDVDLIFMATHGESSLRHFFVGSTALDVLSQSKRPVSLIGVDEKK